MISSPCPLTTTSPLKSIDEAGVAGLVTGGGGPLILLFNKPYGVVCQFSAHATRPSLKDYIAVPGAYPAGRLDWDSEGLLVLTDEGGLQHHRAAAADVH